jgi:hypothetical protein
MPNAESRITEKRREYEGEKEAAKLVNWLNATKDDAARERIINVVALFMRLMKYELALVRDVAQMSGDHDGSITPEQEEQDKAAFQVERELNRALDYYTVRPDIQVFSRHLKDGVLVPEVSVGWTPIPGSQMHQHQKRQRVAWSALKRLKSETMPGTQLIEVGAIRTALALMVSGAIFRIALCRCEKFFYKRFSHQRFCSGKCRIADFSSSEESRKKRNEYARKLYHLHKKLDSGKPK